MSGGVAPHASPAGILAKALATTGASVNISNAAPPVVGQVLRVISPTAAEWGSLPYYNATDYGLVGDGIDLIDGAITASSTSFSSASANFTSADTGKLIGIKGAGTGGGWLITTITYISPTTVNLAVAASYTVTAKEFFFGTDDSDAWQLLLDEVFAAGGGRIIFHTGLYLFNRALQTAITGQASITLNPNCQFYIPNLPGDTGSYYVPGRTNGNVLPARVFITIEGEAPHSYQYATLGGGTNNTSINATRLRSTIQGSGIRPAFFGGLGGAHGTDNNWTYNPACVEFKNIHVELTTNSSNTLTMGGLNLRQYKIGRAINCTTSPHTCDLSATTEPSSEVRGITLPYFLCEPSNYVQNCTAVLAYHGIVSGEHGAVIQSMSVCCTNGLLTTKSQYYSTILNQFTAMWCKYMISADAGAAAPSGYGNIISSVSGQAEVNIVGIGCDCEPSISTGKWYEYLAIVNDPDSYIRGTLETCFLGAISYTTMLDGAKKIGGNNLKLKLHGVGLNHVATHTGTTHTLAQLYEAQQTHSCSHASGCTVTVPNSSTTTTNYDFDQEIIFIAGAGTVTLTGASGVTVRYPTGLTKSLPYGTSKIRKIATNTWHVTGDLQA